MSERLSALSRDAIKGEKAITPEKMKKLIRNSPVGKIIKFQYHDHIGEDKECMRIVTGPIEAVYANTFRCCGRIYQWKDYIMGYIY